VRRRDLPPPAPATVYELTETANRLKRAILSVGEVGLATLDGPERDEDVRAERLVVGLRVSFRREEFADITETYELVIDGEPFTVEVGDGVVETRPGGASSPSMSLRTDADTYIALMAGRVSAADALARGSVTLEGKRSALERFIDAFAYPSAQPAAQ
jgi:putative sterol carrier protein